MYDTIFDEYDKSNVFGEAFVQLRALTATTTDVVEKENFRGASNVVSAKPVKLYTKKDVNDMMLSGELDETSEIDQTTMTIMDYDESADVYLEEMDNVVVDFTSVKKMSNRQIIQKLNDGKKSTLVLIKHPNKCATKKVNWYVRYQKDKETKQDWYVRTPSKTRRRYSVVRLKVRDVPKVCTDCYRVTSEFECR
ncbi:hypothetical protein QAD02_001467 [Eretmocerus hayati]|uniref:Uncharacterized protein n=1 Tax=Eretmocerus hayati TaxID=131215 RepID=A0ACC2NGB3_9HYME|nr:hypothetical protein QAD02_001467 [Eretmocerus hayati]